MTSNSRERYRRQKLPSRKERLIEHISKLYPTLERDYCYSAIACGEVYVDGHRVRDHRQLVGVSTSVTFQKEPPFASRAGYKLSHALSQFGVSVTGKVILDAGSATGGFTDCLLRSGACHVHCVDVAHGALTYRLRQHHRTTVHERTNVMHLTEGKLDPLPSGAVCDLSFRSLRGVAARLITLVRDKWLIALIKPQFELVSPNIVPPGFKGRLIGADSISTVVDALTRDLSEEGVGVKCCTPAPLKGKRGNREILALLISQNRIEAAESSRKLMIKLRRELKEFD